MIQSIRVIINSVVTWVAIAASVATVVAGSLPVPEAAQAVAVVAAVLTASVAGLRRVAEVLPQDRGVLPSEAHFDTEI